MEGYESLQADLVLYVNVHYPAIIPTEACRCCILIQDRLALMPMPLYEPGREDS